MRIAIRLAVVAAMVLGCVAAAVAQNPPQPQPTPQPTPPGQLMPGQAGRRMMPGMQHPDRAAMLRAQIEARFGERVKAELGLTDQQMDRLQMAARANEDRTRDLNRREADMARAVMEQLRPGIAANQDSLGRLLDGIAAVRVQRAQSEQQELRELGQFLNPVQRARLLLMRRQLLQRIQEIRGGAPGGPGMVPGQGPEMGPGMGPGMRPGMPMRPDSIRPPELAEIDW